MPLRVEYTGRAFGSSKTEMDLRQEVSGRSMYLSRLKLWLNDPDSDGGVIRRLLTEHGAREVKPYLLALGLGAISAMCIAATAYLIGTVVNQAYINRNFQGIVVLALAVMVIFTIKGMAMYGSSVVLVRISNRIVAELQRQVFDKLLIEGLGFYANRHSSEFLHRVTRGSRAAAATLGMLVNALGRDLLTLAGLVTVMLVQEPILSLIGLVVMPPAVFFVRDLVRRTRRLSNSELKGAMYIFETLQETLRGLPVVKAFTLENEMRTRIRGAIADVEQRQNALARLEHRTSPVMETLGGISIALVLLYGGYLVIELNAAPGAFVSFITAFLLAYEPAKRIAKLNINLTRSIRATRMLFEILDSPPTEPEEPDRTGARIEKGEIRFDKVRFAYKPGEPVLQNVSFVATAGKMTAFVGHSGGGKSTVIALILRFYESNEGAIEVDGVDIRRFPRHVLRRHIAYVGQDVFLFRGSVRENIAFGKSGASEDEVIAAAKAANAHDFIAKFSNGYDTQVGEAGVRLSTGQRQRIAVARALIRNAPIILLDEATSSLDGKAEREVQLAIDRLREGRTCIAVAHRLHTITQADRICVMEQGRIIEMGTHAELIAKNGFYAEMFRLQSDDRSATDAGPVVGQADVSEPVLSK